VDDPNQLRTGQFLDIHQAFICQVGEQIVKIDKLIRQPTIGEMNLMLEKIRQTGERTATTTKRGPNHPCQVATLRCDHQGFTSEGLTNTQIQLGGSEQNVERNANQSTSVTQVNLAGECYLHSSIKSVLAMAHDHSWRNRKVINLYLKGKPVVDNSTQFGTPRTYICVDCGENYGPVTSLANLSLITGSYPARCSKKKHGGAVCDGVLSTS
jgi:hypothetical protein